MPSEPTAGWRSGGKAEQQRRGGAAGRKAVGKQDGGNRAEAGAARYSSSMLPWTWPTASAYNMPHRSATALKGEFGSTRMWCPPKRICILYLGGRSNRSWRSGDGKPPG
ncbi:unnamed protein product [Phaeothamnion confervicola]